MFRAEENAKDAFRFTAALLCLALSLGGTEESSHVGSAADLNQDGVINIFDGGRCPVKSQQGLVAFLTASALNFSKHHDLIAKEAL